MIFFTQKETPYLSQFVFDGDLFILTSTSAFTAGQTQNVQLKTGVDKTFHTLNRDYTFDGGGPFTIQLIENPTVTDGTTPIVTFNLNRTSALTTQAQIFSNPTGISGGTVIDTIYIPPQGTGGGAKGELSESGVERILKKNTNYILRSINGGGASTLYSRIVFYESSN